VDLPAGHFLDDLQTNVNSVVRAGAIAAVVLIGPDPQQHDNEVKRLTAVEKSVISSSIVGTRDQFGTCRKWSMKHVAQPSRTTVALPLKFDRSIAL
jgi:hypothetical protein